MTRKGQYIIDDTKTRGRADTSFCVCIVGLLIFILFCATIIIVAYFTWDGKATPVSSEEDKGAAASKLSGKNHTSSSPPTPTDEESTSKSRRRGSEDETDDKINSTSPKPPMGTDINSTSPKPPMGTDSGSTDNSTASTPSPPTGDRPAGAEGDDGADGHEPPPVPELSTPSPTPLTPAVCESLECKEIASNILSMMGHGTNRCNNFYDYACGGLHRNKYLSAPDYSLEALDRIIGQVDKVAAHSPKSFQKFKTLQQSCNKYDADKHENLWRTEVLNEMKAMKLEVMEGSSTPNFTNAFLELLLHDRPIIFDVRLDVNDTEPTNFSLKIVPAKLKNPSYPVELNGLYPVDNELMECQKEAVRRNNELDKIYDETIKCANEGEGKRRTWEAAREALRMLHILQTPDEADKRDEVLREYMEFIRIDTEALGKKEERLLELQRRNLDNSRETTITHLNKTFENLKVDWKMLIEGLINRPLEDDERIEFYAESYFSEINKMFETKLAALHNALLVALAVARHRDLLVEQQRWRRAPESQLHCARLAALLLPDVASALYLRSFPQKRRDQFDRAVEDLFFDVTTAFLKEIDRAEWLRDAEPFKSALETKAYQLHRSNSTEMKFLEDTARLDSELQSYEIEDNNFVKNTIVLMARNRKRLYERIDKNPKECIWTHFIAPYDSDGKSIYSLKTIAIPLGIAEKPFFDVDYPLHIRMASLGFVVAHEFAHHFDSIGIHFVNNITSSDIENYKKLLPVLNAFTNTVTVKFLNQTDSSRQAHLDFKFDDNQSKLKQIELISNKIGIKLAFQVINIKPPNITLPFVPLTIKQSFFVHLTQRYCTKTDFFSQIVSFYESPDFPEEPRVDMMVKNNDFYETFNCSGDRSYVDFPYEHNTDDLSEM